MEHIYHVVSQSDWNQQMDSEEYIHPSLAIEGFIHCSKDNQVEGVLNRYYQGQTGLLKLVIDPAKLTSNCIEELATSIGEMFPHIFGPINKNAVVEIIKIN